MKTQLVHFWFYHPEYRHVAVTFEYSLNGKPRVVALDASQMKGTPYRFDNRAGRFHPTIAGCRRILREAEKLQKFKKLQKRTTKSTKDTKGKAQCTNPRK